MFVQRQTCQVEIFNYKKYYNKSKLFGSKNSEFENEALEAHNTYRREHGSPPLTLSKDLCKVSQKWADELAKNDQMTYSLNKNYGESIYCGWSADPNTKIKARDCVDKWYSEINDYSFSSEPEVLSCGHFTQIIWKTTKELGIGCAKSKSGKLYVVANYYPPGNYSGQFSKNIAPPGAFQFKADYKHVEAPPKEANNNVPETRINDKNYTPPQPQKDRTSKHFGNIASDLVNKFKSSSISDFEEDCLKSHNEFRKKHGVPPLVLNKKLSKYSDEWAKELVKKKKMEHRDQDEYGENIFYAWSSDPNFEVAGKHAVEKWYSEIKDYRFGKEPMKIMGVGHFTQVIWEDTKEVGVGIAKSKDGHVYVVANYYPPGNVIGSFNRKVPPPLM